MAAAVAPCSGALIPETAILTDPHCLLTRNQANVPYLKNAPRMPQRSIFNRINHMKSRRSVNTSIPTTIVPSMVRRHKNHPRPHSVA
ncbi:hypothetical protein R75471_00225 [Paraburkholderia domus]|nr:hypothetical protein R75483_03049 [Paraburkholderia domus]CAE6861614.1 hypothetical protein R75471_00225 [Paraburkholderia domus]